MTSENGSMYMPVAPAYGAPNAGGFGMDGLGGGWGLLILILLLFGRGYGGYGNNNGGGNAMPWVLNGFSNTDNIAQRGFDQAAVINGINSVNTAVTNGFGNVQTALCSGFAGVNAGVANGFAQAEIANNARQIADMQQMFGVQSALQNCCCQQSANTADLKYTVATEACADRNAISMGIRDVNDNNNRNHQAVMDKLCQLEMDGYKQRLDAANNTINQLRTDLLVAQGRASQNDQTAAIQAGQRNLATEIEQYVNPTARPAWIVPNPSCCQPSYNTCGCGA